ncbi:MAG: glycosyltransferase family 2 protein [Chloroflexi bacterium]|nr:glycosyltransferase family 2 protein [Chloroflexota bacterium]
MTAFLTSSVILCAYTEARWHDLVAAVASVQRQTLPPGEIIVVVDHNPRLLERARAEWPDLTVIENSGAQGLSGARNSGVAMAQGALIVFLDDDAAAAPDWLERLSACYADPSVVGVGGAILPAWRERQPGWFPAEFAWVVGCTYRGMPTDRAAVRNLIGCNMSFRRGVFDRIGGFRIGRVGVLSIGQENDDTEFCIRLGTAQPEGQLIYEPSASVAHNVPSQRATFAYFVRRCYSEGLSKARLGRLVGRERGLSSERDYTLRTLPSGVWRGLTDTLARRDLHGVLRAGAIVAGLGVTTAGYAIGLALQLVERRAPMPAITEHQPL